MIKMLILLLKYGKEQENAETIIDFCGKYQRKNAAGIGISWRRILISLVPVTNDSAEAELYVWLFPNPSRRCGATKAGFICKLSDVLGIEVKDEVGNLNKLFQVPGEQHQY